MQVPAFTTCYVRSQSAQDAGRVATGFPLPSTGRGIEGEGWSYPEPPPVRFFLYQPHPGSRLNTEHFFNKTPEITLFTFLHFETAAHNDPSHRRQPLGGRARHSVRAAIDIQAGKPSQLPLSQCFPLKKQIMQVPVFTTCYARRQRPQFIRPVAPWWTKSRCDSVCLRSRHFVAWLCSRLTNDFQPRAAIKPRRALGLRSGPPPGASPPNQ